MAKQTQVPVKRKRIDFTDEITVLVGADESRFTIHKSVITEHSAFFRTALEGGFKEAKDRTVRLPETDIQVFSTYAQWMYHGEIVLPASQQTAKTECIRAKRQHLIDLYILADSLDDKALRNRAMDEYRSTILDNTQIVDAESICRIWYGTSEKSKLRQFVVDTFSQDAIEPHYILGSIKSKVPSRFMADVAIALARELSKARSFRSLTKYTACNYHEHDETVLSCDLS